MTQTRDRLLTNAGGLLVAAGGIAAFIGGWYGLSGQRPGLILASILLLMGYGVVGYLLMNHGPRYFQFVLPAASVLVVFTLLLFQSEMGGILDDELFLYLIEPGLALILVYAAGALLTHFVEHMTERVTWPARGAKSLHTLLHIGAYAPIWCAFTLLDMLGPRATATQELFIVGGSVLAGIGCVVGGHAAGRGDHPGFTVVGAAIGFAACAAYLFQFMLGGGNQGAAFFGQFNALIGLILTGLPVAIGSVAWIQVSQGVSPPETDEQPGAAP